MKSTALIMTFGCITAFGRTVDDVWMYHDVWLQSVITTSGCIMTTGHHEHDIWMVDDGDRQFVTNTSWRLKQTVSTEQIILIITSQSRVTRLSMAAVVSVLHSTTVQLTSSHSETQMQCRVAIPQLRGRMTEMIAARLGDAVEPNERACSTLPSRRTSSRAEDIINEGLQPPFLNPDLFPELPFWISFETHKATNKNKQKNRKSSLISEVVTYKVLQQDNVELILSLKKIKVSVSYSQA